MTNEQQESEGPDAPLGECPGERDGCGMSRASVSSGTWILLVALTILTLLAPAAAAQVRIEGVIVDAQTGHPIISGTVQVGDLPIGAITSPDGRFSLMLQERPTPERPITLEVRHVGYQSASRVLRDVPVGDVVIELEPDTIQLDELVVEGGNPAIPVVEAVLARRERMMRHIESMYADLYTRFLLYSNLDLVQMRESVRSSWWRPSDGSREIIRAERSRPPGGETFRFVGPHPAVNLHDEIVPLDGTRYSGPLHRDALSLYQFTFGEPRVLDGRRVHEIYFVPRRETESAFTGRMSVVDSTWHVLEISARPYPATVVTPPVKSHRLFLDQRFVQLGDTLTVPIHLSINGVVEFGQPGASYPTARYEQSSRMSLHVINTGMPDSIRASDWRVRRHPLADGQDHLFDRNPSLIPLTPREVEAIASIPPTMTLERAFRPEGLLRAYTAVDVTHEAVAADDDPASPERAMVDRAAAGDWFWYNRVDGWHPGFGWGREFLSGLHWRVDAGYSDKRRRGSYRVSAGLPWRLSGLAGVVGVGAADETAIVARQEGLGRFVPGLLAYLGYDDFYDYYHRRAGSLYLQFGRPTSLARLRVTGNAEVHSSLETNTDFDGWLFRNDPDPNPPIGPGTMRTVEAGLSLGRTEISTASFTVERTLDGVIDSDYHFTRFEGRGTVRFSTFFEERARPNRMRLTVIAGTKLGDLPVQRQFSLSGSAGPLSEYSGFRTLSNTRFISERLYGLFWSHDFTTVPFELLGLWWLAERGMGIHVFGGHAQTYSEAYERSHSGEYHEFGLGVTYPLGLPIRLEAGVNLFDGSWAFRFGRAPRR